MTAEKQPNVMDAWLTPGRFALCLGLLLTATYPSVLLGRATFIFRDFGMFSYPVAFFQRECFWRGELPLWNSYNNCGIPFLAQWNTMALYPPALIYLLLPLSWSLSFFCLLHLFWGGLGMYQLARQWTQEPLAASLAGVIFTFNGLSLTFLMWPSHVATFSWAPWVLCLGPAAWRQGGKSFVYATAAASLQMLAGGPETIVVTWLGLGVLAVGDWLCQRELRSKLLLRLGGLGILVTLVCAVQLLPFLQLLAHSQRDRNYGATAQDWCMPFWGWANFLVPLFRTSPTSQGVFLQNGQYWTTSYYAGIGTVLLALAAVWRVRDWRVRLLSGLLLLSLILALGDATLLYRGLRFCFPGLGFVRYPVKFVIPVLILAPLLAAMGLGAICHTTRPLGRFEKTLGLVLLVLIGLLLAVDSRASLPDDAWRATWQSGVSRGLLLAVIVYALTGLLRARGRTQLVWGTSLLLLFWLDLSTHSPNQNPTVKPSVYTPTWASHPGRVMTSPQALDFLKYQPLPNLEETYARNRLAGRVDCNLLDHRPQIEGFFSLVPREISRVTSLPYDHRTNTFVGLLDFLAVAQVTAPGTLVEWATRPTALPLVTGGQQPRFTDDTAAFAALSRTNLDLRQIVFLPVSAQGAVRTTNAAAVHIGKTVSASRQRTIEADAPSGGWLVISQTDYPAWRAYVDGAPVKLWRANYAFQAVEVPAGRHRVQLVYEDRLLLIGAALSGSGFLICGWLWRLARRRVSVPVR